MVVSSIKQNANVSFISTLHPRVKLTVGVILVVVPTLERTEKQRKHVL